VRPRGAPPLRPWPSIAPNSSSPRTNTTTEERLNKNKFLSENGFVVLGSQGEVKVDKEVKVGGRHMKKKGKKKVNFVMMGSDLDGIKGEKGEDRG